MKLLINILKFICILCLITLLFSLVNDLWILFNDIEGIQTKTILIQSIGFRELDVRYLYVFGVIKLGLYLFCVYQLFAFRKILTNFSEDYMFKAANAHALKIVGKGFVIIALGFITIELIMFIMNFAIQITTSERDFPYGIGYNFAFVMTRIVRVLLEQIPFIIVAIFLMIMSQLIQKGYWIKRENDLTI